MEYYYINKKFKRAAVFGVKIEDAGTTIDDYKAGKFVKITKKQAEFYKENPQASFSEIMAMEMLPQPEAVEIPYKDRYKALLISKIRSKYDIDDEMAILRKKDVEPDKFAEYNAFCEACKAEAKLELTIKN